MTTATSPSRRRSATPTASLKEKGLIPASTELPRVVSDHVDKAAGEYMSRAAMLRKIIVEWSEANKASR